MALPFLYSWWHDSNLECADDVPEEDLQFDSGREEEEELCWVLGQILLVYISFFVILRILFMGLVIKQHGGSLYWNWMKCSKDPPCGCICYCKFSICGPFRKTSGGKEKACPKPPLSSPPIRKQLNKCQSKTRQKTRGNTSSGLGTFISQVSFSSGSSKKNSTSTSLSGCKRRNNQQWQMDPSFWPRKPNCPRCNARRTREWLAKNVFDQELAPREKEVGRREELWGASTACPTFSSTSFGAVCWDAAGEMEI
ncbi:hypothetical protein JRQ81_015500 [Phrynocephalus forsythii]|uniref:Uncharacterized protein n=1 Tax=Phrynocephalus forsythii TaxID=171643 RepID=A0A9Q0XXC9_9SAUR|nr:hypothetical protein JRQ81_015500 [Phrynocephalus forsythii]